MHLWVSLIWYFCTCREHEFLSNDISLVSRGGKMASSDNSGGVEDGLGEYFVVCRQLIVGWNLSQSQYRTSLEGLDMTVSPPYSQDWYTSYWAWSSAECDWLCWLIDIPLSHCRYVAVQKYRRWNCHRNPFGKVTLIYDSQDASLDIQNWLHAVLWVSGASERWVPATMLQTRPSGRRISSWTTSGHSKHYHESLSRADSQCGPYQRYCRWWLQSQHRIDTPEIAHACRRLCLPPHKSLLLQQSSFEQDFWQICFWDQWP